MRLFIVFFSLYISLTACQEIATPVEQTGNTNVFFDLKGFFEKEKVRLKAKNSFKKTVSINEESETKDLMELDLANELSIFIASDINKPAWSDKYKVDSTFTIQNQLESITYSGLVETLKTKKIEINFSEGVVSKIAIEKATDNAVAQAKQILTYEVGKGYSIKSEQDLRFSDRKTITVQVVY